MGRPPGAPGGGTRRRYPRDWELRDPRFEEIDSEDEDGEGVILDPNSFAASRDPRARGGFVSDELYFDGYDVGQDRISRRSMYDYYGDEMDARQLEYRDQEGLLYQTAAREKEEELIESALERIRRARSKGKTNVNLSEEEMEALERRRGQQPEPPPPNPPLASPPATPAKPAAKGKASSRSNSSTNLASKARKRNSGLFGSSPSPAKSNSKAKVNRKGESDRALTYPAAQAQRMITGSDGAPLYAYYGSQTPEIGRSRAGSNAPSRSSSKHRRRESTPPAERMDPYVPYPPRYYLPPSTMRPESSGSNRSLPDDDNWQPPIGPRHRSTSNVQYAGYPSSDYENAPPMPAVQGRRNFSGPADVRYSNIRRGPPPSRPLPAHASQSDPAVMGRRQGSGLSREFVGGDSSTSRSSSSSSGSGSDREGVQVDILPEEAGNEFAVARVPMSASAPTGGNEGRKRRGGRR